MNPKQQYKILSEKNAALLKQIDKAEAHIDKNTGTMQEILKQATKSVPTDFFTKKSLKIEINDAFDMAMMAELAKLDPVKFVEKYLTQYKPRVHFQYDLDLMECIMIGKSKTKKAFSAEEAYNAYHNTFTTACPGIMISTQLHNGGPVDRDWCEASIKFYAEQESKKLQYSSDNVSGRIYDLCNQYNKSKRR